MQIATKSGFDILKEHEGHTLTVNVQIANGEEVGAELYCVDCRERVTFTQKPWSFTPPREPEWSTEKQGWDVE